MNNNEQMEFDTNFADLINEGIPSMYAFFTKCVKVGFKRREAFELTRDVFTRGHYSNETENGK